MFVAELPYLDLPLNQVLLGTGLLLLVWLLLSSLLIAASSRGTRRPRRPWIVRGLYVGYLALIAVLAVSSFGTLLKDGHLVGYPLMLHVAAAGGFVFLMVAIAALYLPAAIEGVGDRPNLEWWGARWSAWALLLSSLAAAGTMLVSMLPWLDTAGLQDMAWLHRYAGLAVVVSAVLHAYALSCLRLGWR